MQNVVNDITHLVQIGFVNIVALFLLGKRISNAALADILDGEGPELINCLPQLMPRTLYRLQVVDPSR